MTTDFDWIAKIITRELSDFVINVATNESIQYSKLKHLLTFVVIDTPKIKKRIRNPATENRCIARLVKDGEVTQCSHKALVNNRMCKRHSSCDLKYGTINDELPEEIKITLKKKPVDENKKTNEYKYTSSYNLNLFPKTTRNFKKISISDNLYYMDNITKTVYSFVDNNYYYIGNFDNIQSKIKYINTS